MSQTVKQARKHLIDRFRHAGIDTADVDARLLLMAATGFERSDLIVRGDENLLADEEARLHGYLERRLSGEPVDSILGYREFYERRFEISRHVLSPRPETEGLIDRALHLLKGKTSPHILDLGTGSGAILITLLAECPQADGVGVDISEQALAIAGKNAKQHHVSGRATWLAGDWFTPVSGDFDLIVSNPPYITDKAMKALPTEVSKYDPDIALRGGLDGLDAYRVIVNAVPHYLKPDGVLVFEIGYDQGAAVQTLMKEAGFTGVSVQKDLAGHDRVVSGTCG